MRQTDLQGSPVDKINPPAKNDFVLLVQGGKRKALRLGDLYAIGATPPDVEYDFQSMNGLPAEIVCTAPELSSRGLYVHDANSSAYILASSLAGFVAAYPTGWTAEIEFELNGDLATNRTPIQIGSAGNQLIQMDVITTGGFANQVQVTNVYNDGSTHVAPSNLRVGSWGTSSDTIRFLLGCNGAGGKFAVDGALNPAYDAVLRPLGTPAFTPNTVTANLKIYLGRRGTDNTQHLVGWIKRLRLWNSYLSDARAAAPTPIIDKRIVGWGDSLTAGSGASTPDKGFVYGVGRQLGRQAWPEGVAGQTSTQIAARFAANLARRNWVHIFWAGRNDPTVPATVVANVQAMVNALGHSRYLVKSIVNRSDGTENAGSAAYNQIIACNAALAAAFPGHYLDIRSLIVAASSGVNDAPAPAWTADGLHYLDVGYDFVARQDAAFIQGKGW